MTASPVSQGRLTRVVSLLNSRLGLLLGAVLAVTAVLLVPFIALAPDETASTEPTGDVFTARDRIDDRFVSDVYPVPFVISATSGDLLLQEPLAQLLKANETLRADDAVGPDLFSYFDPDANLDVVGVVSLAELVDQELRTSGSGSLATATDADVKAAGAVLVERLGERSELLGLSAETSVGNDGDLIVPAVIMTVLGDNDELGFGNGSANLGTGTESEEWARDVQTLVRTASGIDAFGIAIDPNLTADEEGAVAGPFIGFTILAALLLVGFIFRSYWVLATVSVAFMTLIVWLKGVSNLIGLKDDLVLSLIVPIAMISFGVDFVFHAVGRYRESRADGLDASSAAVGGLTSVFGALFLALLVAVVAFLANVTAGIESIVGFGIGAAIALTAAFLLLGIVGPLLIARIEAEVNPPRLGRKATAARLAGGFGAAGLTMASVLLLVFIQPVLGVVMSAVTAVVVLVVPFLVSRRRRVGPAVGDLPFVTSSGGIGRRIGSGIAIVASKPAPVLGFALALTAAAAFQAVKVPAAFDVEDFFSPTTDFVVSLDQADVHLGDRDGEPALVYIEGDLTDPDQLARIAARADELRELDLRVLAVDDAGRTRVRAGIFDVFSDTLESPAMLTAVENITGVAVVDADLDGIPDSRAQVAAVLSVASDIGVVLDEERLSITPGEVNTLIDLSGEPNATVVELSIVNSRSQESVTEAREAIEPIAAALSADLGDTFVQVTGGPIVRESSLEATNRAFLVSLPVAVILCLLVAAAFLRSLRYGIASIVPILMVVAWLYAVMEIAGYAINIVTATIAAVSIGIGIEFAIHFIARYKQELSTTGSRAEAVRKTGEGTGVALAASAASSALGFAILAFAPMPLFATYGLLTVVMIGMALVATLLILPSVLVLITNDSHPATDVSIENGPVDRELANA